MNIDASFHVDGSGSAGSILRNERGEAIAGFRCPLSNVLNATTAEALAFIESMEFLEHLGVAKVILESDPLELIQACRSEIDIWCPYTAVLADIFMRARSFNSVLFQHCPREADMVAHLVAKFAYASNSVISWDDDPPEFISSSVLNDVTLFANQ
jgi:ribonuclease HI